MARPDETPSIAPWCLRPDDAPRNSRPPWMESAPSAAAHATHEGAVDEAPSEAAEPTVPASVHLALVEAHAALLARHEALVAENAALHDRRQQLVAANDALARDAETARERLLVESVPEMVRLACAVASRVVGGELLTDPAIVVGWVREAVAALGDREAVAVSVAPDIAASIPSEEWSDALGSQQSPAVDASLAPGAISVRSGASTVHVSAAARFAAVAADLHADAS